MRLVNIAEENIRADRHYHSLPQPMTVYHSTEEFLVGEHFLSKEAFRAYPDNVLIEDYNQFTALVQKIAKIGYNEYDFTPYNCWFKTKDEFVPESYDNENKIIYKKDENGDLIPTDGCYVRVYYTIYSMNRFVLVASSGLNNIFFTKWDLSAAIRSQFASSSTAPNAKNREKRYEDYKNRTFARPKATANHIKLVHSLFNPLSDLFLDLPRAMKIAFPKIKANDRTLLLQTKAFRSSIMELIKSLQPDLKTKLIAAMPPEAIAGWMKEMIQTAITGDNFKDKKEALEFILDKAYTDNTIVNQGLQIPLLPRPNQPFQLPPEPLMVEDGSKLEEVDMAKLKDELDYPEGAINDEMYEEFDPNKVTLE
ncbi:MAG: hypothetical protein WC974_08970 [Thermoplasmata archaeon]